MPRGIITLAPFRPTVQSPHLQTIAGHVWPRPFDSRRFPVSKKLYQTDPDAQVLVETQQPAGVSEGEILLVHGLEGSADAGYMRSLSYRAVLDGYTVHRLNLRSCGRTEHLSKTVYHGGLTGDLLFVLRTLQADGHRPPWLVAFSLGGNLVAKLGGELGEDAKMLIRGICAASAAIDLKLVARRVGQRDNRLYEARFVRLMQARARAVRGMTRADLRGIRSVFELDDRITGPAFGFKGRGNIITQNPIPANQFLDRIQVPALFITAKDDTFIPFAIYDHPAFRTNPHLQLVATEYGGHVGFIAKDQPRLWLDYAIMNWIGQR